MPSLPKPKDPDKLIIFVIESIQPIDDNLILGISEYLNSDTSFNVKVLPISSEEYKKPEIKCIYPVIPNEEIISLLEKISHMDDEVGREAKSILRMLKNQKLKD